MSWYYGEYFEHRPRIAANGIRAKTRRGKFGQTWWADRWLAALERLVDPARLQRGRSYARSGQVLNLDISAGSVRSRVQGSRPTPYSVRIDLKPLTDQEWDRAIETMAGQAIFAAKLLAGEMPADIEDAFAAAGISLFPASTRDLTTTCSCPDWANPCKHVAAVYYLLGERFDEDPFLLFQLRGRTRQQIMAALRQLRSLGEARAEPVDAPEPSVAEEIAPLLDESLDRFWIGASSAGPLVAPLVAPAVEAAPIKQLGVPPFWDSSRDFMNLMTQLYAQVTRAALDAALGE